MYTLFVNNLLLLREKQHERIINVIEHAKQDKYYLPIIYLVKRYGSLMGACKALKISHQRISHWNKQKSIPDAWKVLLHKKYQIPYKSFFEQLEK